MTVEWIVGLWVSPSGKDRRKLGQLRIACALLCALILVIAVPLAAQHEGARGIRLYNENRLAEARGALEHALSSDAASVREMTVLGMTYTRLGQHEEARSVLTEAQDRNPFDALVHVALGMLEFELRNFETACHHFHLAERFDPGSQQARAGMVAALVNSALLLYQEGDTDEAEARLLEAHSIDPQAAVVLYNLSVLARERGDTGSATQYLEKAVQLAPHNPQAFAELGTLHMKNGNPEAAHRAFQRAVSLDTEEPFPYYYLAGRALSDPSTHQPPNDDGNAPTLSTIRSHLHSAIGNAIRKGDMIRVQAAKAVSGKEGSLADRDAETLKELSAQAQEPHRVLKDAIELLEQTFSERRAFIDDLQRLQSWYPHNLDLGIALGHLLLETGRLEEAKGHWSSLIGEFPTAADAHMGLADTLMALGDTEAARVAYMRARDLGPESHAVYTALLRLHQAAGSEERLMQRYRELYARERGNTVLLEALASLEERLGYPEPAERHRVRAQRIREARE